jgi:hypothetical protein
VDLAAELQISLFISHKLSFWVRHFTAWCIAKLRTHNLLPNRGTWTK